MKNEISVFSYDKNKVRTIIRDGELWFVLKDVCDILGISNPTVVSNRLEDDEVTKFNLGGLSGESNIINESGLYSVILLSRKPEARKFKKWVTSEVLPSIRKTGAYIQTPQTYIQALEALIESEREKERLSYEKEKLQIELDESKKYYTIKRVAKINRINWKNINWKRLKNVSYAIELEIKKVFDANFESVNAYHIDVWRHEYPKLRYSE